MTQPTIVTTFPANWRNVVQLETAWQTDITLSTETQAEERRSLWGRPNRTQRILLNGTNKRKMHSLLMKMARHSDQQAYIPLYPDQAYITNVVGPDKIYFSTAYRRFYQGHKAIVLRVRGDYSQEEILVDITGVFSDRIEVSSTTGIQTGDVVYPAMLVEVSLSNDARLLTDETIEAEISFPEVIGPTSLPASENAYPPSGFPSYLDYPVLDPDLNWKVSMSTRIIRGGNKYPSGRSVIFELNGRRPQYEYSMSFLAGDRATYWNYLRFFDSIKGRKMPFWLVAPQTMFEQVAFGANYVDVTPSGDIDDIAEMLDYMAIVLTDDTPVIRKIASVAVQGDSWRVTFTTALPDLYSMEEVSRVTAAHLVRSSIDYVREIWHNADVCTLEMSMFDLLEESIVELDNVNPGLEFGWPATIPDLLFWFSAKSNCYYDEAKPATIPQLVMDGLAEVDSDDTQQVSIVNDVRTKPFNFSNPFLYALGVEDPPVIYQMTKGTAKGLRAFTPVKGAVNADTLKFGSGSGLYTSDFFSNVNGLTIVAVWKCKSGTDPLTSGVLFSRDAVAFFSANQFRLYETTDGPSSAVDGLDAYLKDDAVHVIIGRWVPGLAHKVYIDGKDRGTFSGPAISTLPTLATAPYIRITDHSGPPLGGDEENDDKFFELLVWPRALTTLEMNTVGFALADIYSTDWKEIV